METLSKGLSFGLGIVNAGMKNVAVEPELVLTTTTGGFRITSPVSKALGIGNGDYVTFINNLANLDKAIAEKDATLVAFCEERGLDIETSAAAAEIYKEFGIWGIAKGVQEFDKAGNAVLTRERIGVETRRKYVSSHFEEMLEAIGKSENEELKASVNREGITKEEQVEILAKMVQGDETPKYKGSKAANTSNLSGTGIPLTFTDSNIWSQLRAGMEDGEGSNRVFSVDITNLQDVAVDNGYKVVTVKCALLGAYKDVKSVRAKANKE